MNRIPIEGPQRSKTTVLEDIRNWPWWKITIILLILAAIVGGVVAGVSAVMRIGPFGPHKIGIENADEYATPSQTTTPAPEETANESEKGQKPEVALAKPDVPAVKPNTASDTTMAFIGLDKAEQEKSSSTPSEATPTSSPKPTESASTSPSTGIDSEAEKALAASKATRETLDEPDPTPVPIVPAVKPLPSLPPLVAESTPAPKPAVTSMPQPATTPQTANASTVAQVSPALTPVPTFTDPSVEPEVIPPGVMVTTHGPKSYGEVKLKVKKKGMAPIAELLNFKRFQPSDKVWVDGKPAFVELIADQNNHPVISAGVPPLKPGVLKKGEKLQMVTLTHERRPQSGCWRIVRE